MLLSLTVIVLHAWNNRIIRTKGAFSLKKTKKMVPFFPFRSGPFHRFYP